MSSATAGGSGSAASRGSGHASRHAIDSLVCFSLSGRSYALDVALVREVVPIGTVFPVPQTPAPVTGVFSLRGATVALVDTTTLLGIPRMHEHTSAIVIVRNHQTICALTIDHVVGVSVFIEGNFIPADHEREPPEILGFLPDERGGMVTVLDSSLILSALQRLRFR